MPRIFACTFAVAITAISAAEGSAQTLRAPTIRDSAGIRIVEHRTIRDLPPAFRIVEKPTLDLGGLQDDLRAELNPRHPFHHAVRLSDGRILVADRSELRLFDAGGKILQVIGREGQGPGEFGQLREACVIPGDTIIAINYSNPRVSVFDRTGAHVRTFTPQGRVAANGCLPDGTLLLEVRAPRVAGAGAGRGRGAAEDRDVTVHRIRSDGTLVNPVGTFPGGSLDYVFSRTVNLVPHADSIYAGDGRTPQFGVYTATGKLVRIVRWNDPLVAVTAEMVESSAPRPASGSTGTAPPLPPTSATLPAYREMKVDPLGRVWVEDYVLRPARDNPGWTVFSPSGALLGRVSVPKLGTYLDLVSVDRDQVTLRWRDADGAAHVSFHPLAR